MKYIKTYKQLFENIMDQIEMVDIFNQSDILESIMTDSESLLKSINAEEVDLFTTFGVNPDNFKRELKISDLFDNDEFNKRLHIMKLKKGDLEYSEDIETFLKDTTDIKFFLIHKKNENELEQPEYIIFQSVKNGKLENLRCYKVRDDMNKFYDKLTSKTIELKKGDKSYIYNTSNSGLEWSLKNMREEEPFKKIMGKDEIKSILKDGDISIKIIA